MLEMRDLIEKAEFTFPQKPAISPEAKDFISKVSNMKNKK
jgi:hypothetical protein